jgi:uncharacterized membrane protein YkvA (DUF1232 family)
MAFIADQIIEPLIKKAEKILGDSPAVTKLADDAFAKLGELSERFYELQDTVLALVRMVRAWVAREYTQVSPEAIVAAIAALIYFVSPIDIIPDFIPLIGHLDDMLIVGYLVKVLNKELERFLTWEFRHKESGL